MPLQVTSKHSSSIKNQDLLLVINSMLAQIYNIAKGLICKQCLTVHAIGR